jgi:hypothetical protein
MIPSTRQQLHLHRTQAKDLTTYPNIFHSVSAQKKPSGDKPTPDSDVEDDEPRGTPSTRVETKRPGNSPLKAIVRNQHIPVAELSVDGIRNQMRAGELPDGLSANVMKKIRDADEKQRQFQQAAILSPKPSSSRALSRTFAPMTAQRTSSDSNSSRASASVMWDLAKHQDDDCMEIEAPHSEPSALGAAMRQYDRNEEDDERTRSGWSDNEAEAAEAEEREQEREREEEKKDDGDEVPETDIGFVGYVNARE